MREPKVPRRLTDFSRVIITGASSGIGKEFLKTITSLNPCPPVCNLSRTNPAQNSSISRFFHISCDLSDPQDAARGAQEALQWAKRAGDGPLLLINNSGFGSYGPFPAPSGDHHLRMIELNVRAPVRLTACLESELTRFGGAVVNIASTAAFQPTPYLSTYGATKAFLLSWSLGLSEDWRGRGIAVLAVCPGPTSTNFFSAAGFEQPPVGKGGLTAARVVADTASALARGKPLVVCGMGNKILAAASSRLPKALGTRMTALLLRRLRLERYQKG